MGTPPALVERFNAALNRAMESPEVSEKFSQLGLSFNRNNPADFAAFLRAEVPKWSAVVKSSGAQAN